MAIFSIPHSTSLHFTPQHKYRLIFCVCQDFLKISYYNSISCVKLAGAPLHLGKEVFKLFFILAGRISNGKNFLSSLIPFINNFFAYTIFSSIIISEVSPFSSGRETQSCKMSHPTGGTFLELCSKCSYLITAKERILLFVLVRL